MIFYLLASVLAAPQYDVQTLGGETVNGAIVAIDSEKLVVQHGSDKKEFNVKDLLNATAKEITKPSPTSPVVVELIDGSRLAARNFQSSKDSATISVDSAAPIELPMKALRWIRLVDAAENSAKLNEQWNEITAGNPAGDLLVIRKKGSLDSTDGVVGDISAEAVAFTLDGDKIDVKRTKVEGIVFAHTAEDRPAESICTLTDVRGSRYCANSLKLDGDAIQTETPAGLKITLPLANIARFDFSSGKLLFLSDLEPESFTYEPFFAPANAIASLNSFYRLRRDIGFEKNPLKLGGRVYSKGIAIHSRSVVTYRLPGKFRLFKATAGIDDAAREGGGDVALEIKGDGKSLWKGSVRGSEASHALELDISGVKRLEIVADFGEGQDVADHLDLCDAQITK